VITRVLWVVTMALLEYFGLLGHYQVITRVVWVVAISLPEYSWLLGHF